MSATADYTDPHAWSAALHEAGFHGIRYHVRHDPRAYLAGLAWFGHGDGGPEPLGQSQELPASLLLDAAPFGIRIAANLPAES